MQVRMQSVVTVWSSVCCDNMWIMRIRIHAIMQSCNAVTKLQNAYSCCESCWTLSHIYLYNILYIYIHNQKVFQSIVYCCFVTSWTVVHDELASQTMKGPRLLHSIHAWEETAEEPTLGIPWHSLELRQAHPWLLSAHTKWWSERGSWHVPLVAVQWGWMRHMWSLRNAAMQLCRRWSIRDHGLCTGLSSAVWHWDMKMLYYLTVMQLGCVHKPSKGKNNAMQCKYYS